MRMVTGNPSIALKMPRKSARCIGSSFFRASAAVLLVVGEDHGAHVRQTIFREEHVLGAAQADAFCSECACLDGVARNVGIGANLQLADADPPRS